eukprot:15439986-Alexandrium_andersonii.AAC.1
MESSPNKSKVRTGPALRWRNGGPANPHCQRILPWGVNLTHATQVIVVRAPPKEVAQRRGLRNPAFA